MNASVLLLEPALTHNAVHVLGDTLDLPQQRIKHQQVECGQESHDGAHTDRRRLCHHRPRRRADDGYLESRPVS